VTHIRSYLKSDYRHYRYPALALSSSLSFELRNVPATSSRHAKLLLRPFETLRTLLAELAESANATFGKFLRAMQRGGERGNDLHTVLITVFLPVHRARLENRRTSGERKTRRRGNPARSQWTRKNDEQSLVRRVRPAPPPPRKPCPTFFRCVSIYWRPGTRARSRVRARVGKKGRDRAKAVRGEERDARERPRTRRRKTQYQPGMSASGERYKWSGSKPSDKASRLSRTAIFQYAACLIAEKALPIRCENRSRAAG